MKKFIFRTSAFIAIIALVSFCKTSRNSDGSGNNKEAATKPVKAEHSAVKTDSAQDAGLSNDSLKLSKAEKYAEKDIVKKELPEHRPPAHEKTDSIKEVKTRGKLKGNN